MSDALTRSRGAACEEHASENFYDTLAAFMSRVNLANSASFAPRGISRAASPRPFVVSRLTCRSECTAGDAIKPARNDAVPQSLLSSRAHSRARGGVMVVVVVVAKEASTT